MGLDSVELVMEWEKFFKINIPDNEAEKMITVQMAVDYISCQVTYFNNGYSIKEKVLKELSVHLPITNNDLNQHIVKIIPLEHNATWNLTANETGYDFSPLLNEKISKFFDRIFPQKDNINDTTVDRFVDLVCAVNYQKLINGTQIRNKYEVMIAVMGITIDKIGIDPFEIFLESSFTKDLGVN